MQPVTESQESHGTTERLRQEHLTERLGTLPARRAKTSNFKWATWKWRLGMRG
jgi:hypothetical protein